MRRGVIGRCDTYYDLLESHGRTDRGSKIEAGIGIGIGIEDRGAPDGAVAGSWWLVACSLFLVPSYKLPATSYLHTRRPLSSGVGQPTI